MSNKFIKLAYLLYEMSHFFSLKIRLSSNKKGFKKFKINF